MDFLHRLWELGRQMSICSAIKRDPRTHNAPSDVSLMRHRNMLPPTDAGYNKPNALHGPFCRAHPYTYWIQCVRLGLLHL